MTFRFLDLFAGIGGFHKGAAALGGECVGAVESDLYCVKTYQANFPHTTVFHCDANDIIPSELPDFDLLCAGFPCQPFSVAGKKRGERDKRHVFNVITTILRTKKPRWFLLENVPGLRRIEHGDTLRRMGKALDDVGYKCSQVEINANKWVPQNRNRLFIASGNVDFYKIKFKAPCKLKLGDLLEEDVDEKYYLKPRTWQALLEHCGRHKARGNGFGPRVLDAEAVAPTLSARYGKDGSECLIRMRDEKDRHYTLVGEEGQHPTLTARDVRAGKQMVLKRPNGWKYYLHDGEGAMRTSLVSSQKNANLIMKMKPYRYGQRVLSTDGHAPTAREAGLRPHGDVYMTDTIPRRLTPRECSRLMGFDEPQGSDWVIPVSDSQAYKQFGNAVVPAVVTAVLQTMIGDSK